MRAGGRDVEDAVPYGRGSNMVAETFVNAAGEGLAPPEKTDDPAASYGIAQRIWN